MMALLCGTLFALGQGSAKVMHKIYTNTYGNVTVDCPTEVEDGGSFSLKVETSTKSYGLSILQSGVYRGSSSGDNGSRVVENVTGTIIIEVTEHTKAMIGDEEYALEQASAHFPPSQSQIQATSVVMKNIITVKGKNYEINGYSGAYDNQPGITSITLPNGRFSFTPNTIDNQSGLTEIHATAIEPADYRGITEAFGKKDLSGVTLYVPEGSKAAYAASAPWNKFKEIVEEPLPDKYPVSVVGYGVASSDAPDSIARGQSLTVNVALESGFYSMEPSTIPISGDQVNQDIIIHMSTYKKNTQDGILYGIQTTQPDAFCLGFASAPQKELTIPEVISVESNAYMLTGIFSGAFENQTTLEKVTIKGRTVIDRKAFAGCTALKEIHCESAEPGRIGYEDAFEGVDKDACIVYVPAGATDAYKAANGWKLFKNIVEKGECYNVTYELFDLKADGPTVVSKGGTLQVKLSKADLGTGILNARNVESTDGGEFTGTMSYDPASNTLTVSNINCDVKIILAGRIEYKDETLAYRFDRCFKDVFVTGLVKKDAKGVTTPEFITFEGENYYVQAIDFEAFKDNTTLRSITFSPFISRIELNSFVGSTSLSSIHLQNTSVVQTKAAYFDGVDKGGCIVYVPASMVEKYKADAEWKVFKNIVAEGTEITYAITYDLTNLTATPQPATVKHGSDLAFQLKAAEGYKLPDSILVNDKNMPDFYDKASGEVSIPNLRANLSIKAVALKTDTAHIAAKDTTLTNDVDHIEIAAGTAPEDTAQVTLSGVTTPTVNVASEANAKLVLSGENDLGEITNEGTLIISASGSGATLTTTTVTNKGVLVDESGLITEVTGTGALSITPVGDKDLEEGSSIDLTASATPNEDYQSVIFLWQKLENGIWTDKRTETKTPAPQRRSLFLRAALAEPLADTYKVTSSEAGTYRCVITNKATDDVSTTLTTITKVTLTSTPAPSTTYSVTLPSVEGVTTTPSAGSYSVEEGDGFSFSLTLAKDYDQSKPVVKAGDKVIEPISGDKYEIKNITSDVTISITGIVKNTTVGNAEVDSDALKVWGENGRLHILSAHPCTVYIATFAGRPYRIEALPAGESMIEVPQGAYIVRIGNQSYKIRF